MGLEAGSQLKSQGKWLGVGGTFLWDFTYLCWNLTKSQRSVADTQAPLGRATTRSLERVAAAVGLLDGAPIQFEGVADVPDGGVLFALPALLLYGLFVQRGLRTAMLVKDDYSKLLASGLSFMFALQVFVIVGGVTRVIPLTGITTPFLSQGGSSLVASWMLIAVLMRVSDTARRPPPQAIQDEGMTQVVRVR